MNLLNEGSDSTFATRKWNIVNDLSNANYGVGNELIYNAKVLKSNLCDYDDAYILIMGDINIVNNNGTQAALNNCAPFTKCITKINGTTVDDAEDLALYMQIYNFIEYSWNYSKTTGSLWLYSKDQATTFDSDVANGDAIKSFKCKAKLLEDTVPQPAANQADRILKNVTNVVPLKYLSNFWR